MMTRAKNKLFKIEIGTFPSIFAVSPERNTVFRRSPRHPVVFLLNDYRISTLYFDEVIVDVAERNTENASQIHQPFDHECRSLSILL